MITIPPRPELLDAMLADWAQTATEAVIAQTETAGAEPHARLERLTRIAAQFFEGELELELRSWGRRDAAVGRVLTRVDRRRTEYLRQLLRESGFDAAETEARAFLLYSSLFGNHLLPSVHGRYGRKRVPREAFELLASPTRSD